MPLETEEEIFVVEVVVEVQEDRGLEVQVHAPIELERGRGGNPSGRHD